MATIVLVFGMTRLLIAITLATVWQAAGAQDYPSRPIRMVTTSPGGGGDIISRLVAQGVSPMLEQQVVVDNRGGGGGIVAGDILAKTRPDGYTIMLYSSTIWMAPLLTQGTASYDVERDFAPITLVGSSPYVLVVNPSLPVKSVKELIGLAASKPGVLNYGTSGTGSLGHIAGELFKSMAKVDVVRINYKGALFAITDTIAGNVHLQFGIPSLLLPYATSGKLRALAHTGKQASAVAPGLPTLDGTGVPGYEVSASFAMFAPAKTPQLIINRLNNEVARFLKAADVRDKILKAGVDPVASSPAELGAFVKADTTRLRKVITDAGIKGE